MHARVHAFLGIAFLFGLQLNEGFKSLIIQMEERNELESDADCHTQGASRSPLTKIIQLALFINIFVSG